MNTGIIYQAVSNITGLSYIGYTTSSLSERVAKHKYHFSKVIRSSKFYTALYEQGFNNFTWNILAVVEEDNLQQTEMQFIALYNTFANGYNSSYGGENTFPKQVLQYDYYGNLLNMFSSISEAANRLNLNRNCISRVINGQQQYYKDFIFIEA